MCPSEPWFRDRTVSHNRTDSWLQEKVFSISFTDSLVSSKPEKHMTSLIASLFPLGYAAHLDVGEYQETCRQTRNGHLVAPQVPWRRVVYPQVVHIAFARESRTATIVWIYELVDWKSSTCATLRQNLTAKPRHGNVRNENTLYKIGTTPNWYKHQNEVAHSIIVPFPKSIWYSWPLNSFIVRVCKSNYSCKSISM